MILRLLADCPSLFTSETIANNLINAFKIDSFMAMAPYAKRPSRSAEGWDIFIPESADILN
jgi:hypothetical protein